MTKENKIILFPDCPKYIILLSCRILNADKEMRKVYVVQCGAAYDSGLINQKAY